MLNHDEFYAIVRVLSPAQCAAAILGLKASEEMGVNLDKFHRFNALAQLVKAGAVIGQKLSDDYDHQRMCPTGTQSNRLTLGDRILHEDEKKAVQEAFQQAKGLQS
jgi:hypothetical protein